MPDLTPTTVLAPSERGLNRPHALTRKEVIGDAMNFQWRSIPTSYPGLSWEPARAVAQAAMTQSSMFLELAIRRLAPYSIYSRSESWGISRPTEHCVRSADTSTSILRARSQSGWQSTLKGALAKLWPTETTTEALLSIRSFRSGQGLKNRILTNRIRLAGTVPGGICP